MYEAVEMEELLVEVPSVTTFQKVEERVDEVAAEASRGDLDEETDALRLAAAAEAAAASPS